MCRQRDAVLQWLEAQGAAYRLVQHPAASNMEEIAAFGVSTHGHVAKNLFLRDSKKGTQHFLVTVRGDKQVDLKSLGRAIGQRLSFASENRLKKYLDIAPGAVSPLAVLFDEQRAVQLWLDEDLAAFGQVGVHPADNTATVFLPFVTLVKLVENHGNPVKIVHIPE